WCARSAPRRWRRSACASSSSRRTATPTRTTWTRRWPTCTWPSCRRGGKGGSMVVIVWEFRVVPGSEAPFEAAYGPRGDWAELFGRAEGYLGTELLRDAALPGRYLTLDRWATPDAFARFRAVHGEAYAALDARCEAWTQSETRLGAFEAC